MFNILLILNEFTLNEHIEWILCTVCPLLPLDYSDTIC